MYTIEPRSLKEFVDDNEIKLPRFQRKSTWNNKQFFELALSVFKNYPLGATICFKEIENKEITKWLLDGRQRRNTLLQMYENPEKLYEWGEKYLGIKNKDSSLDIRKTFFTAVEEYVEKDVTEEDNQNADDDSMFERNPEDLSCSIKENEMERLDVLLDLLLVGHENSKRGHTSGITGCFDMKEFFSYKNSIEKDLYTIDKRRIDCKKLKKFLKNYREEAYFERYETFEEYMNQKYAFESSSLRSKFKNTYSHSWATAQLKVINIFDCIDSIMSNRKLAVIETSNISPADAQKIFNLINNSGTQLTASEILSAKPKWNKKITGLKNEIQESIKKLYDKDLVINSNEYVKWDIPASLCIYLADSGLDLFFSIKETDISKKITLGFKILSGLYNKGIKKEDINDLANDKDNNFNWECCNDMIDEVKSFFKVFKENMQLKCIKSWGKSLADVLGDGPTLNYLFTLYRIWKRLGCPTGGTTDRKIFDKNCFILLDRSFYEYLSNQWKGSSDSTIARNIENVNNEKNSLLKEVEKDRWDNLLENLFEQNLLNEKSISKGSVYPLVYYYNILKNIKGDGEPAEVDHIIPQAAWESSTLNEKDIIMNNTFNLALLPKKINSSKKDKSLMSIRTSEIVADQISEYEEIGIQDFEKFSYIENYPELKSKRNKLYLEAFGEIRTGKLINSL